MRNLLKLPKTIFRFLASLKLAVTLIVLLAAILAAATFAEADKGRVGRRVQEISGI